MLAESPFLWIAVTMQISVTKNVTCIGVPKSVYFIYIFTWAEQSSELGTVPTDYVMKLTATEF